MSIPAIIKYPLDLTGTNSSNLVSGETVAIPRSKSRAFAPRNGPFFASSFKLYVAGSTTPLKVDEDYEILYMYEDATRAAGQPICAVVHVINPAIFGDLVYDYQVIGGNYSSNVEAIKQAIDALEIDSRAVAWDDVLDKPVVFPPAPHLHHVNDMYGMEAVIEELKLMRQAISEGDSLMKEQILDRLSRIEADILAIKQANVATVQRIAVIEDKITQLELR